jgi:hypothetical protein
MKTLFIFILILPSLTFAWGKRGHETVGSLAAQLLAKEYKGAEFLINHSFDMGYYNNVPDLVWKADSDTYKKEYSSHYMDMELFNKEKDIKWNKDRKIFFKKYPHIENSSGRSYWRIQELYVDLANVSKKLSRKIKDKKEQHNLQAEWLVIAGTLGHYVADLAQPLHVTENYDGQLTQQKGIHHWFEEEMIDQLYPDLQKDVFDRAKSKWAAFHKEHKSKSPFDLAQELGKSSAANIEPLLKLDKQLGRKSARDSAAAYKEMALDRLTQGVLFLAEIWSREVGWKYNGDRFYNYVAAPKYIEPWMEREKTDDDSKDSKKK